MKRVNERIRNNELSHLTTNRAEAKLVESNRVESSRVESGPVQSSQFQSINH